MRPGQQGLPQSCYCQRCGKLIPRPRRVRSDYCTNRCADRQHRDDLESAMAEAEHVRTYYGANFVEIPSR